MDLIQKLGNDYLLGCIKYNQVYKFYLMPVASWILNYKQYDPLYNPVQWEFVFRDNILNVTDENVSNFLMAIKQYVLDLEYLKAAWNEIPTDLKYLYFLIDFDNKLFVNAFPEIELEKYLPDNKWIGEFNDPKSNLPQILFELFTN